MHNHDDTKEEPNEDGVMTMTCDMDPRTFVSEDDMQTIEMDACDVDLTNNMNEHSLDMIVSSCYSLVLAMLGDRLGLRCLLLNVDDSSQRNNHMDKEVAALDDTHTASMGID